MRACVYFSNPHPFYMFMVMNSIKMIRNYNQSIPIYLYFIDTPVAIFNSEGINSGESFNGVHYNFDKYDKGKEFFTDFCNLFNVKVVYKPWKKDNLEYFPINKIYLCECEAESVAFLDADTFIFRDIEELFDANQKNDFIACKNHMPSDWSGDFLGSTVTFNSGVMLFNNSSHKRIGPLWANQCEEIWRGDTELSSWIKNGNKWRTEEVSISKVVLDNDIDFSYFPRSQVFLPKMQGDVKLYSTIVYHSFTQNWRRVYNLCQGSSRKLKNRFIKK